MATQIVQFLWMKASNQLVNCTDVNGLSSHPIATYHVELTCYLLSAL